MATRHSIAPPSSGDFGTTSATSAGEQPVSPPLGDLMEAFHRYVTAKVVKDIVDERVRTSSAELERACLDLWCESLLKTKPNNLTLTLAQQGHQDTQAFFQVEERFAKSSIRLSQPAEGETLQQAAVRSLTESGLSKEKAETFVANEVDVTPVKSLRPFNELFFGHYEGAEYKEATLEEKAVGAKLMRFVNALPPDERRLVLLTVAQVRVKKGMIARVTDYAEGTDEIKAIFQVFSPISVVSREKLGISGTPEERLKRMKEAAVEIIDASQCE